MLVISCGMLRSGSTLQYQLASALVEAAGSGEAAGWFEHGVCAEIDRPGELVVIKVHNPQQLEGIAEALQAGEAVYLYSYRDIRDVMVSIQHKWQLSFAQVLRGCYLDYILKSYTDWMALPRGHIAAYETFVQNPRVEAHAIAAHLGLRLPDERIDAIAADHTLPAQQERMEALRVRGAKTTADGILHSDHIFSGASEQWRAALKPHQIGYLEYKAGAWLEEHHYAISQPAFQRLVGVAYFWYCLKLANRREDDPPKLF